MFLSLKGALGRNPMLNRVGQKLLQSFGGAAAAYSLRNLASNIASVVRVRRASDNSERDFSAEDISSGAMTEWVNSQIVPPLDIRELDANGERTGALVEAAAAYSLRNLSSSFTGNVVEVRRSSDGEEDSFTASDVADGTLEDWVTEEQVGWNLQPTWDVSSGDGVISSQSSTATTSTFLITTTSGASFIRQSSKPNHIIASSGDQVVVNITLSGFDESVSARLRTSGTNTNVAQQTLSNGTADYTFTLTGSAGYFAFTGIEATSGATLTVNSIKVIGQSGFVAKWYDQSGNANHATKGTDASQPKIVDAGSLVSGGINFDGVNDTLDLPAVISSINSASSFTVARTTNASATQSASALSRNAPELARFYAPIATSGNFYFGYGANTTAINLGSSDTDEHLFTGIAGSSTAEGFIDGTSGGTVSSVDLYSQQASGGIGSINSTTHWNGTISEIILYSSDQSDNRTAIEANIGEVYSIDLPSGVDTGYDQVDGFVETWYDQSGNGNDAVQQVSGSQPKIVDAGVLVSGGLDFDGVDDFLQASIGTLTQPISGFSVFKNDSLTSGANTIWDSTSSSNRIFSYAVGSDDTFRLNAGTAISSSSSAQVDGTDYLRSDIANSSSSSIRVNGSSVATGDANSNSMEGLTIGARYDGNANFVNSSIQEIIIYPSDQSANRVAIEANINNQYDIYA